MENHPIPQDVTGFQFRLIGNMTVKQFAYLAVGATLAFITYYLPIFLLIKLLFMALFGFTGFALAFIPLEGRPMDAMIGYFLQALFSPNQYLYQKSGGHFSFEDVASPAPLPVPVHLPVAIQKKSQPVVTSAAKQKQLQAYLKQLGYKQGATDKKEDEFISNVMNQAAEEPAPLIMPTPLTVTPLPSPTSTQPTDEEVTDHNEQKEDSGEDEVTITVHKEAKQDPKEKERLEEEEKKAEKVEMAEETAKPEDEVGEAKPHLELPHISLNFHLPSLSLPHVPTPHINSSDERALEDEEKALDDKEDELKKAEEQAAKKREQEELHLKEKEASIAKAQAAAEQVMHESTMTHDKLLELEKTIQDMASQKLQLEQELQKLKTQLTAKPPSPQAFVPTKVQEQPKQTTQFVRQVPQSMSKSSGLPPAADSPNVLLGVVKDPRGGILPNILIEVKDKDGNPVRAFKTNQLGQFASATQLANGTYTIEFEDPQGTHKFDTVELTAKGEILMPIEVISHDMREELRKQLFS